MSYPRTPEDYLRAERLRQIAKRVFEEGNYKRLPHASHARTLSEVTGFAAMTIYDWFHEECTNPPSRDDLITIAKATGTDPNWLLRGIYELEPDPADAITALSQANAILAGLLADGLQRKARAA